MRKGFAWAAAVAAAGVVAAGACTTNDLVGQGGACFQSIDCQLGLVCIYAGDSGTCTNDLDGTVFVPEAGGGGDVAQPDAPLTDAPADQNVSDVVTQPDTGTPDTGTPDTGTPDTGANDAATD